MVSGVRIIKMFSAGEIYERDFDEKGMLVGILKTKRHERLNLSRLLKWRDYKIRLVPTNFAILSFLFVQLVGIKSRTARADAGAD